MRIAKALGNGGVLMPARAIQITTFLAVKDVREFKYYAGVRPEEFLPSDDWAEFCARKTGLNEDEIKDVITHFNFCANAFREGLSDRALSRLKRKAAKCWDCRFYSRYTGFRPEDTCENCSRNPDSEADDYFAGREE